MVGGICGGKGLRPLGMVYSVGVELSLQADAAALAVVDAILAVVFQEVAGVELDTAAVGRNAHGAAGSGVMENGAGVAEDLKIVVKAALQEQRLIVGLNIPANGFGCAEVHGGTVHTAHFAGGDAVGIGYGKGPGGEGQLLGHGGSGAKDHGRNNQIEGKLEAGQKVVVVEDLISTGGSVIEVVNVLREAGAEVLGVVSIFTYGMQKGIDRLAAANVKNISLTNFDVIASVAAEEGYIKADDVARLIKFRNNPSDESWIGAGV